MNDLLEDYEEWLKLPHESWEIADKLRLFEEAIHDAISAIANEKWDSDRLKRMKADLQRLVEQKRAFEKIKWRRVEE